MKPTIKQLESLQQKISACRKKSTLTNAEIGKLASVHPSQVGRICAGDFKTISNNVVEICRILKVRVPKIAESTKMNKEWAEANASLRRIWDHTPQGANVIRRMLDAIADLHAPSSEAEAAVAVVGSASES